MQAPTVRDSLILDGNPDLCWCCCLQLCSSKSPNAAPTSSLLSCIKCSRQVPVPMKQQKHVEACYLLQCCRKCIVRQLSQILCELDVLKALQISVDRWTQWTLGALRCLRWNMWTTTLRSQWPNMCLWILWLVLLL